MNIMWRVKRANIFEVANLVNEAHTLEKKLGKNHFGTLISYLENNGVIT